MSEGQKETTNRKGAEPRGRGAVHETRAQETVHPPVHGEDEDAPWEPPSNMAAPEPRPGYVQRWVRTAIRNEDDAKNEAHAFQMGWLPRRGDTVPKGFPFPTISHGKFAGCVGVHGMVLCEMTKQQNDRIKAYFKRKNDDQVSAVRNDLRQVSDRRMPLKSRMETDVVFERNVRRPRVADDVESTPDSD